MTRPLFLAIAVTCIGAGCTCNKGPPAAKLALIDRAPESVVETIYTAAREALLGAGSPNVSTCGVGVAGQLEGDRGVVTVAPNLGWRDVPFGQMLATRLGHRVRLVNDL